MGLRQSKILLVFCLVLAITAGLLVAQYYLVKPQKASVPFPKTFADVSPGSKITTILAPNGKMSLIVKEEKGKDGDLVETFSVQADSGTTQIYSETLAENTAILVPYNTFSPDNKYLFFKRTGPSGISYFVLKTDGSTFPGGEKTIDFVSLFNAKYPDHKVTEVTGWGGINLIVMNTDLTSGVQSHSFWFEVPTKAIIQLTNRFN